MKKPNRRKAKPRGSSRAGRPRKQGERHPCGKLKTAGPNVITLRKREAGDALAGEHPMDFALSKGWVTERQHKDAMAYRATFNAAHVCGPSLAISRHHEATPSEDLRMNWSQMTDAEIAGIFDQVFGDVPMPEDALKREQAALAKWRALNASLNATEREELFAVCVLGSWPFWMPKAAAGHDLGARDQDKRARLFAALNGVGRAMRPPRPKREAIAPVPFKRGRAGRTEVAIRYETQDGQAAEPTSDRGIPFEATILRRRA